MSQSPRLKGQGNGKERISWEFVVGLHLPSCDASCVQLIASVPKETRNLFHWSPVECQTTSMALREAILLTVFVLSVCGDVPYCKNEIPLNQSNMDPVYGWEPIAECRLHQYRSQDVVHCLDKMSSSTNRKLHFVVLGDSRMRQQFFEFLSVSREIEN